MGVSQLPTVRALRAFRITHHDAIVAAQARYDRRASPAKLVHSGASKADRVAAADLLALGSPHSKKRPSSALISVTADRARANVRVFVTFARAAPEREWARLASGL